MAHWKPSSELSRRLMSRPGFSISELASEVDRLTIEHLNYTTFMVLANELQKNTTPSVVRITYSVAKQVLRYFLGDDWVTENVTLRPAQVSQIHKSGRKFLKSSSNEDEESFRHQDRVIKLAECLFNLQHVPGIEHRIENLRQGAGLEAGYAEFQCARVIAAPELKLRFIKNSCVIGSDYDGEISTIDNRVVCCEIKTKDETTQLSQKTIFNTMEKARKQLPKGKPGMVFIKLPEHWVRMDGAKAIVDSAVSKLFRSSTRIVGVVLLWEWWEQIGAGRNVSGRYEFRVNEASPFYETDISVFRVHFGSFKNRNWLVFDSYIASRMMECIPFILGKMAESAVPVPPPRDLRESRSD